MKATDVLRNTKLSVKLIRSTIGRPEYQRTIVRHLGFRRLNQTKIHEDGPRVWGMLEKVLHLVKIERIHAEELSDSSHKTL
ncbi:50S ribosomal protein L30 [Gracilariopsis chorda]|uniref:Large ribosomal subunit protein uL30m n=1 Tax=Gracilariopsis chorda TaxID=448386 RepID=A0A2V3IRY2_9FLOR|nr:50S ribosomal protein L30 [Gracilariopsis chorda]|eukprot:PXF44891.1 50S ribosomal protein L30 [Gracilariopsis chorda]